MCGRPLRDFFCDALNVCAEAASLQRVTREEAVRRTDSKGLRPKALALDHCSLTGITSSGTGVLTKRGFVSNTPIILELRRSRRRRTAHFEEPITPRRGAPREVQRSGSGGQPRVHVLAVIRSAHAHPAPRTVGWPTFWCGHPVDKVGCTLDATHGRTLLERGAGRRGIVDVQSQRQELHRYTFTRCVTRPAHPTGVASAIFPSSGTQNYRP